ncbi:MAG: hypothetical protein QNJ16_17205 [Rhodobacter sp.]|nr:hypothetical protein [Rhodobacter sp.]
MPQSVTEQLDKLRASVPDARVAAFVDLESELVLANSASTRLPQEDLDRIAGSASRLLAARADLIGWGGSAIPDFPAEAILLTTQGTFVFLRSPKEGNEAFCCVCGTDVDANQALAHARAAVDELAKAP